MEPEEEITRLPGTNPKAVLNYDDQGNLHIIYRVSDILRENYFLQDRIQNTWRVRSISPRIPGAKLCVGIFGDRWWDALFRA